MSDDNWHKVREIFDAALRQAPAERQKYVRAACGQDKTLLAEVESLLSALDSADGFMETPAVAQLVEAIEGNGSTLVTGDCLGHYEIIEQIGVGGMGEVYLAEDKKLDRRIALKILNDKVSRDEANPQRFIREAKAASALNHPNILVIHEFGEIADTHFIVSEFVAGKTLRDVLKHSSLQLTEALELAAQIASALVAAHEAHLVHRDIKPENIMIRPDGLVKVLDFGLAKLVMGKDRSVLDLEESTLRQNDTARGVILGTVNYMSPEQAKGEQVDERTDIFSLGVVIYEMLMGKTPFAGDSLAEIFANLINGEPPPLSQSGAQIPVALQLMVSKMLQKKADERYQTTKEFLTDLKDLKETLTFDEKLERSRAPGGHATEVVRATAGGANQTTTELRHSLSGPIRQHKSLVALALIVFFVSAATLVYYFFSPREIAVGDKKSLAVLPLKPINTATRDELYEIGIADSLIQRLSMMKGFIVRPLSAVRRYASLEQDPIAAGKEQRVDYVLAANYQLADGKIRIIAQLFNVANGQIEETYQSERDVGEVFAMQDAIASEVSNKLFARFVAPSSRLTAKRGTTNEEAYRLYLQGMYLANNRNPADARKAVESLEQAVRLDPNYAQAWAGVAYAHRTLGNMGGSSVNPHEEYQKSIEAINKALALNENLADAYSTLCENKTGYEYDFDGAEKTCKRAIELNPDSAQAHDIFARYLMSRGRHAEAIAEINTAVDLEPASRFSQRNLGIAFYYARRYPEAVAQFKRVIAMDATYDTAYWWLTTTLALQGNEAEAFRWLMKLLSLRKADEETVAALKTAFQNSGWQGLLRERIKRLENVGEGNIDGAAYSAQIGDRDKAFEYLEKVYQRRGLWMAFLQVDPRLDALRDDPRFAALVRRIEVK